MQSSALVVKTVLPRLAVESAVNSLPLDSDRGTGIIRGGQWGDRHGYRIGQWVLPQGSRPDGTRWQQNQYQKDSAMIEKLFFRRSVVCMVKTPDDAVSEDLNGFPI